MKKQRINWAEVSERAKDLPLTKIPVWFNVSFISDIIADIDDIDDNDINEFYTPLYEAVLERKPSVTPEEFYNWAQIKMEEREEF